MKSRIKIDDLTPEMINAADVKAGALVTFSDLLVSSYQSSGSAGGDAVPQDSFSINFARIDLSYRQDSNTTVLAKLKQ